MLALAYHLLTIGYRISALGWYDRLQPGTGPSTVHCSVSECGGCSALHCVAARCTAWQRVALRGSALHCVAARCTARCTAWQRVALRGSAAWQRVALRGSAAWQRGVRRSG